MFGRVKKNRRSPQHNRTNNPYNCKSPSPSEVKKMMQSVGDAMASRR